MDAKRGPLGYLSKALRLYVRGIGGDDARPAEHECDRGLAGAQAPRVIPSIIYVWPVREEPRKVAKRVLRRATFSSSLWARSKNQDTVELFVRER